MPNQNHIPGKPIYSIDDRVLFQMSFDGKDVETFEGTIAIVDRFGAWEIDNPREPSYDIMVNDWRGSGEPALVKHIRESAITKMVEEEN